MRVEFDGLEQALAHQGCDSANVLFVEAEDAGPVCGGRRDGDGLRLEAQLAGASAAHGTAGSRVVHKKDRLLTARAAQAEAEERAEFRAGGEAAIEPGPAAREPLERGGRAVRSPNLVGIREPHLATLRLREPRDPEEGKQVPRLLQTGEDCREEHIRDSRRLRDAGKAGEGILGHKSSSRRRTQSSNLARRSRKRSSTVPVGPLRCLATITWATPVG